MRDLGRAMLGAGLAALLPRRAGRRPRAAPARPPSRPRSRRSRATSRGRAISMSAAITPGNRAARSWSGRVCRGLGAARGEAPLPHRLLPWRELHRHDLDADAGRPQGLGAPVRRPGLHRLPHRPAGARAVRLSCGPAGKADRRHRPGTQRTNTNPREEASWPQAGCTPNTPARGRIAAAAAMRCSMPASPAACPTWRAMRKPRRWCSRRAPRCWTGSARRSW